MKLSYWKLERLRENDFRIKKLNAKETVAIQNERNCARKFHMDQNW